MSLPSVGRFEDNCKANCRVSSFDVSRDLGLPGGRRREGQGHLRVAHSYQAHSAPRLGRGERGLHRLGEPCAVQGDVNLPAQGAPQLLGLRLDVL